MSIATLDACGIEKEENECGADPRDGHVSVENNFYLIGTGFAIREMKLGIIAQYVACNQRATEHGR